MNCETYTRRVHYYETDQMGIVHHSNYIRWFEEGRVDFLRKNGISCRDMESLGIQIAVTSVNCEYKAPAHFDETVTVETRLAMYNGVRAAFEYSATGDAGALLVRGRSEHCFITGGRGLPLNMNKKMPELSGVMTRLLGEGSPDTEV